MKALNARGKAAHTLDTRRQAGASPAGKNLASSVSAPFCFRAFRPGPRFSFLVGSNLRPMILGKRKTGVSRRVGKGTAARRLSLSEWEGASPPPEPRLGTPTAPRGLTKLLPRRDPAPRHLCRVPSSRPSPGQGSLPRLPPESSEASAHLKAGRARDAPSAPGAAIHVRSEAAALTPLPGYVLRRRGARSPGGPASSGRPRNPERTGSLGTRARRSALRPGEIRGRTALLRLPEGRQWRSRPQLPRPSLLA